MTTAKSGSVPRLYRITAWPVRILIPLATIVAVLGLAHSGAVAAAPIPILLGAAWVYAGESCGLVVTDDGIKSRMTRRENRFEYAWTDIEGFTLADGGAQVAILMSLHDGSGMVLPSTRAWFWDKNTVKQIYSALLREQAAARVR